jgi:hypothetical protein
MTARAVDVQLEAVAADGADCGDRQRVEHGATVNKRRRTSLECSTDSKVRRVGALQCWQIALR